MGEICSHDGWEEPDTVSTRLLFEKKLWAGKIRNAPILKIENSELY
jgi:hypothetical protein